MDIVVVVVVLSYNEGDNDDDNDDDSGFYSICLFGLFSIDDDCCNCVGCS